MHTFADSWAHQNFTAWAEDFNRLDPQNPLPSPGHSQAGWKPDEWLTVWSDPRLRNSNVVNLERYLECAGKIYRYLCVFRGSDFASSEDAVLEELKGLIEAGRGRETTEERMLDLVIACGMEPYDREGPLRRAVDWPQMEPGPSPALDKIMHLGRELWTKTGLAAPVEVKAKPGFSDSPVASWLNASNEHRDLALSLVEQHAEVRS
jgi:hypothetical protein